MKKRELYSLEDSLLDRLYEATARGILRWSTDHEDDNREIWKSELAGEELQVEIIYVMRASHDVYERFAVNVQAFGDWFTASVGTKRYDTVMDMLSFSMLGWREASASVEKKLKKALSTLDSLLERK